MCSPTLLFMCLHVGHQCVSYHWPALHSSVRKVLGLRKNTGTFCVTLPTLDLALSLVFDIHVLKAFSKPIKIQSDW